MVSHPETGSDSPIGSDRDRGRDSTQRHTSTSSTTLHKPRCLRVRSAQAGSPPRPQRPEPSSSP